MFVSLINFQFSHECLFYIQAIKVIPHMVHVMYNSYMFYNLLTNIKYIGRNRCNIYLCKYCNLIVLKFCGAVTYQVLFEAIVIDLPSFI